MMEIPGINEETYWQYAIIARPTNTYREEPRQVSKEIVETIRNQLGFYMTTSDITYRPPNFIIYLQNSHLQRQTVSASPLQTRNFRLKIVPWSKQYELTQLPWITDDLKINIDPLTILPVPSALRTHPGNQALKDNYASMIDTAYELKSPDYSYLLISELRDFYYQKFKILKICRYKTIQLQQMLQEFLQQFLNQATAIRTIIQVAANNSLDGTYIYICHFAEHLSNAANHAYRNYSIIDGHINLVKAQPEEPMNLTGFNKIPPLHEIPVPPSYVTRLKVIYTATTKAAYKAQSAITTIETSTDSVSLHTFGYGITECYPQSMASS
ncbi:uncharacterized protein LOC110437175 isoform X2 [Sorghum bicolor]|uniref:uncharacterized protein LOC110437175 isoform X2 n=1 Tax=Sorghum bicolor TaxID=4558 RepID=UPI000B425BF6|nr:uncharacterized protein LOC110437175 isoform X2 [Sorghum bicolor]|eukprot:XP_021321190.1 uncharacterized protein LOC110437175 isoform X2 [Sorghum bicolor]